MNLFHYDSARIFERNEIVSSQSDINLSKACSSHDIKRVKQLISLGEDVNTPDPSGSTPLHIACRNEYFDIVDLLLENKANPNAVDMNRNTPLFLAIESLMLYVQTSEPNLSVIKALVNKGADPNISNNYGVTPWSLLVQLGEFDNVTFQIANLLINNDANVNEVVVKHGVKTTFLIDIAKKMHLELRSL